MKASVITRGTLTLGSNYLTQPGQPNVSISGHYADYDFGSPETLLAQARLMVWVDRGGRRVAGDRYTSRMAKNDFNRFS